MQNNYTTRDHEKRLLEIGLPEWTADLVDVKTPEGGLLRLFPDDVSYDDEIVGHCWSVGRLMEIFDICCTDRSDEWPLTTDMIKTSGSVANYLVGTYERAAKSNLIDFSKYKKD